MIVTFAAALAVGAVAKVASEAAMVAAATAATDPLPNLLRRKRKESLLGSMDGIARNDGNHVV